MDDQPPRRSRRAAQPQKNDSLPLVPILIGVVILGFVIGAGLSLVGKRGGGDSPTVAVVTAAPQTPQPTLAPVTPAPTDPPTPEPTDSSPSGASSAPATHAPATHAPATHVPATPKPATAEPATKAPATESPAIAAPATRAPVAPTPRATAKLSTPRPVAPARVVVAPSPSVAATQTDAPAASDETDSEFAKLATAVVRQYVAAIARGDDATATAAFGPDAAGTVKLIERGLIDSSTHISHVEAHSAGDNVTVDVDLKSPKGTYFGQYTVHRTSSGAALITDHAINRL